MNARAIILALSGLVILLLGLIIGQNLERSRSRSEQALPDRGNAAPGGEEAARALPPHGEEGSEQSKAPRSKVEYWITPPAFDARKAGFSAWAMLRPGGPFMLERCRAPDYSIPEKRDAPLPPPVPQCEMVVDAAIAKLSDSEIVLQRRAGPSMTLSYSLESKGGSEKLRLKLDKDHVELIPGDKNSLFNRLIQLPADKEARDRYMQRMFGGR